MKALESEVADNTRLLADASEAAARVEEALAEAKAAESRKSKPC